MTTGAARKQTRGRKAQPKTTLCEALPGATATRSASTSASAQQGTSSGILHRSACRRVLKGLSGTFHHSRCFGTRVGPVHHSSPPSPFFSAQHPFQGNNVSYWILYIYATLDVFTIFFFFFLVYLAYLLVSLKTFLQFLFHTLGKSFFLSLSFSLGSDLTPICSALLRLKASKANITICC